MAGSESQNRSAERGSAPSAVDAICQQMDESQKQKRRHFLPALLLIVLATVGFLVIGGVRPDLLERPAWELGMQLALWTLCLLVFPAIGLGLIFPNRIARVVSVIAAVAMTALTSVGLETLTTPHDHYHFAGGCASVVLGFGAAFALLGVLSGAFVQRRSRSSAYWVAGGVSMTALNIITWHCPVSGAGHVMLSHIGGACLLMALACAIGVMAHRMRGAQVSN